MGIEGLERQQCGEAARARSPQARQAKRRNRKRKPISPEEAERRRRQREEARAQALAVPYNEHAVMPWPHFLARNGLSRSTGSRMRQEGKGPEVIKLSERLLGVSFRAEAKWRASRTVG
jgi:hypothetical protein